METKIETAMAKAAKGNHTVVAQFALIKAEEFIRCIPNLFYGTIAQSDGILIQTTNNYYKNTLNLLGMILS